MEFTVSNFRRLFKWILDSAVSGADCQRKLALVAATLLLMLAQPANAQSGIAQTPHNLTPTGPGVPDVSRETATSGLCVFCHTPHNAITTRALWNRELPGVTYTLYQSNTLQANPGQPTGSSRLCLSCHDGILALGSVREPTPGSVFTLGPITGSGSIGTDLSNDHPVSFVYDTALASVQGELADPVTLTEITPLSDDAELQCTSCHDPHEDANPDFLRLDNHYGALCTSCHEPDLWDSSVHATSTAIWNGAGVNPWPAGSYPSVAENACLNCHRSHAAGHPEWLLANVDETGNCTNCHDGRVAQQDIAAEFTKLYHHPIETSLFTHQPYEDPLSMPRHVACDDCHNPHSAAEVPTGTTQTVSGSQRHVSGVTVAGASIDTADYKYEICLKCHGEQEPVTAWFFRTDSTRNIRLRINPANPSFHPVAAPGSNPTIAGLIPPYTASSQIDCLDCHDNDNWTAGGAQPRGPHGSNFAPILASQYQTEDPVIESFNSYALCYGCHDRNTLLQPGSGFPHDTHVVTDQASCAVCHDAHGSRSNTFLVDFMTRTLAGADVVTPSLVGGTIQFVPTSPGHGSCSLSCHGHEHDLSTY
ncbi:MAG: hypothetical protein LJE74_10880 [Proteobacteria bacterium]|nr:hypothetical protein [Pseudomonadota bacterium]